MNLASIIESHPEKDTALLHRGTVVDYGTLRSQVAAFRGGLLTLGLTPGDRVAVIVANRPEFVVAYLAAIGVGLVVVPINPQSPGPELGAELRAASPHCAIVGTVAEEAYQAAHAPIDQVIGLPEVNLDGAHRWEDLLTVDPAAIEPRQADDLAVLLFTSGTAGRSKPAMLTHGNLMAHLDQIDRHPADLMRSDDVVLAVLPMFHVLGLNSTLGVALRNGATVLLVERFDPHTTLELVNAHDVTAVVGAPALWTALANLPEASPTALSGVRLAMSGAARLHPETTVAIESRFGIRVNEGYGLTEASPGVTIAWGNDSPIGSIGRPLPGVGVRLVDIAGDDVLIGDTGEVWVQGPNVFSGYWNEPEATEAALTDDGWLRTGDLAVVNDDGYLFLVDRLKDMIVVSGFNVVPADVETVLLEHPAVSAAAVIGVPHPYEGESVKAFVILEEDLDEEILVEHCRDRLAGYKCPSAIEIVAELPQGLGGKVKRSQLRQQPQ